MLAKHKVGSSTLLTRSTSFLLLSFLRGFFSIGFFFFQGEFLTGVDQPMASAIQSLTESAEATLAIVAGDQGRRRRGHGHAGLQRLCAEGRKGPMIALINRAPAGLINDGILLEIRRWR